jgi:isoleucyl-tRNA synthetase
MKFRKNTRRKAIEYEKDLVQYWQEHKIFEKSVSMRPQTDSYVLYDGPPFITGVPHHGTLLSSIIKDAVPRYWTMKGKRVERVWGWDCHGLPAELYTEKKLGIVAKRDIGTKLTLEEYIVACRDNMIQTGSEWEDTINRIGRWVDFKGAYKTMDKDYMESVWWAFKKLYDEGKIYEGEKVLLYCTHDATPVSKAEVAMDNSYQDVTDPSVYVKFRLKDETSGNRKSEIGNRYLLAWTTTPWTLPSNTALGVGKDQTYAAVELESGEVLVLLAGLVDKVLTDEKHQPVPHKILRADIKGGELIGRAYEPLFENHGEGAHLVWDYPGLSTEEGTGVVHLSPAYGEEDYDLAKEHKVPVVQNVDDQGFYTEGPWKGQYVWDANKQIAKDLHAKGVVWKIEYIRHSYPHCWRCGTKLMYRAHPSWFMDIAGQRAAMLEQNEGITWFPEHIKHGRFAKTVASAPDWNLSRDRFWATALPVWKGTDANGKEHVKVVGSYAELKELSGVELADYHRPWVDNIEFDYEGVHYRRIDKVLDSWFEAGSMPYAQFHYPFENTEKFERNFPGDFIAEYVAQVRAWFYYLHALSVGLWGENTFKNVVVTGTVAGNDGRKMSKSYGNYTDPNILMDRYSADGLRFLLLSSPLLNGEDFSLNDKEVADVARKLGMVWNMYDFFTLYADVDGWDSGLAPGELPADPLTPTVISTEAEKSPGDQTGSLSDVRDDNTGPTNPLDEWIVSRVHQLTGEVNKNMERYDLPNALKPVLPFIDDASNWYVRRSRKRFWKSQNDQDKDDAYRTLHYVLVRLSLVLAPFTPFMAEELYLKLTDGESVHLLDWPEAGEVNERLVTDMAFVREVITLGLAQRAAAGIKVRQPLAEVTVHDEAGRLTDDYTAIIAEELNVKAVRLTDSPDELVRLNTEISDELKREGMMRELVRAIQNARKTAGLQVDDRIQLLVASDSDEVLQTVEAYKDTIMAETLATELGTVPGDAFTTRVKVEGMDVELALAKA